MKGFTHFVTGLAVTSFFPWAVQAAVDGNPLYFIIGGTCALLPDTLDFRIIRYFYQHDIEVTPDPLRPDMQMVADAIAQSIDAIKRNPLRIRLNTIRISLDSWQRYRISINPQQQQVSVYLEEIIDTGGNPIDNPAPTIAKTAYATFQQPVSLEYTASFCVEMFDGPHIELAPSPHGDIHIRFIPWHREYTHSLCASTTVALVAACFGAWQAALIGWCAHASHAMLDQLGYMGSNLLWPLSQKRFPGLKLQHAASAFWNLAAVWTAVALIFMNLHSHTPALSSLPPVGYLVTTIILPLLFLHRWLSPTD